MGHAPGSFLIPATIVNSVVRRLGLQPPPDAVLAGMRLFNDCPPAAATLATTSGQRRLHFLWDSLERSPMSLVVDFAILFRRAIAERLFASRGARFIAECNVTFDFGQCLDVGDEVFMDRDVFLDTRGGVRLGDRAGLAEDMRVFTHRHSEALHSARASAPPSRLTGRRSRTSGRRCRRDGRW